MPTVFSDTMYQNYYTCRIVALNIRNPEVEKLAESLAKLTGESKTGAVKKALRDRLQRLLRRHSGRKLANELDELAAHCANLPVLDNRSPEEILGYDDNGFPA